MAERSSWADYAKAIGIVLVVYAHVARGVANAALPMNNDLYRLVDSIIYSFHMPLFFALSGLFFVQSLQARGARGLIAKKVDLIVYPYILWSLIQGLIQATLAHYTNGETTYGEVFSLLWDPLGQFWFLYALFLIFVVASIVYAFAGEDRALWVFTGAVGLYLLQAAWYPGYHLQLVLNNLVFFAFGVLLNQASLLRLLNSAGFLLAAGVCFAGLQYVYHVMLGQTYESRGAFVLVLGLLGIVFVLSLSLVASRRPLRWVAYLGASSMVIYLMHIIAGSGARVILQKAFGIESTAAHLAVGTAVGVGAPLVAAYLISRYRLFFVLSAPVSRIPSLVQPGGGRRRHA